MIGIVECVINFSEGRNPQVIDRIAAAIEEVHGVALLDRHADSSHNRTVLSFAGSPRAVEEAAVRATGKAAELVDLRRHRGVHPRIGATDVVPFIPIEGVTLEECAALALRAGERIARQFGIPVYLYGAAATRADRRDLADIRRGEFEGLQKEIILNDARIPDFGDRRLHPSAGATAVGAREALIAFNVYLETEDISIAREIARAVRARSGGLPWVKALAFNIPERRQTQVSMNLVNFRETSMASAFAAVRERAERRGIRIAGSEIVGLVPREALLEVARSALQIENFSQDRVLEERLHATLGKRLAGMNVAEFVGAVAGNQATPAGGSVAALPMTQITDELTEKYMYSLLPERDGVLAEMEEQAGKRSIPIVGPAVGRLFYQYASVIGARRIFEMGSAIGYSTIWFARAVGEGGKVYYSDGSRANAQEAQGYFRRAGVSDRIEVLVGDSRELISQVGGEFDLILIDVDKHQYPDAFCKAVGRLRKGGLLIADNVLWSGRVARDDKDRDTEGIREFNRLFYASDLLCPVIVPLRDGVAIGIKQ